MRDLTRTEGTARLADAEIKYWVSGSQGPWLVLASGLVPGAAALQGVSNHFGARFRVLSYRYRGLLGGQVGGPQQHAQDLSAVLQQVGADKVVVLGSGVGVAVALELYGLDPQRVRGLALVGGGASQPWRAGSGAAWGFPASLLPGTLEAAEKLPAWVARYALSALNGPEAHLWARRLGLLGAKADVDVFARVCSELIATPIAALLATARLFAQQDASPWLATVGVPTLAIAAGRDPITPRALVEDLVSAIPGAEYSVLPDATHFWLLDHADHVNLRLEKFFAEHGLG